MNEFNYTPTRRDVLKSTGIVSFVPSFASDGAAAQADAKNIVLDSDLIPEEYDEIDHAPLETDFYRELSRVYPETENADIASRIYLNTDLPATGIGTTVYVFDDPPRPRTVYQTMAKCFDGFADEVAGDAEATVTTRSDTIGTEWRIDIPDPSWYPESGYADVSRLEVVDGAVLSTVVYGPTTDDAHPRERARKFAGEMRSCVRQGVAGSDE